MIYGFLFERADPILIHNVCGYYAQRPVVPEDSDAAESDTDAEEHKTEDDEAEGALYTDMEERPSSMSLY